MIKNLLTYFPLDDGQLEKLCAMLPGTEIVQRGHDSITQADVDKADVIFGNVPAAMMKEAINLKWLHLSSAGTDGYLDLIDRGVLLSNGTGAYNDFIAEHMLAFTGALCIRLPEYTAQQREKVWKRGHWAKTIMGSTVMVLGCGNIGTAYAKRIHDLGAYVIGVRRKACECPEGVDEMLGMDEVDAALPRADIVTMIMPNTPETVNFMDERRIALMKDGALLINCGRGNALDADALYDALVSGKLDGAAIDVAYKEPLPEDDKLWTAPNLIITPHVAGGWIMGGESTPYMQKTVVEVFMKNLDAYLTKNHLPNTVDPNTGYVKKV
ncbi:MAG: D-2-hydroxyacid dehydrogenase [Oscillospiraceae bacterium]|nr:D-2-hydroxyacid dehydrogenase [Oscillospiraceae bacterium]